MYHSSPITTMLTTSLQTAYRELGLNAPLEIRFEQPADRQHGHLSTNCAMVSFATPEVKAQGISSPRELAQRLVEYIKKLPDFIGKSDQPSCIADTMIAGPGFINFALSDHFLLENMNEFLSREDTTLPSIGQGQKIVIEFSSPNIAKPFTIGHLRSTIIGDSLAHMYEALGYTVYRDNHVGDWGTQFGKQIYALHHLGKGSLAANIAAIEAAESPVKELVALYIEFHEKAEADPTLEDAGRAWFKKLEEGDSEARRLWQLCIDWSFKEFNRLYQRLGVKFTENNGRGYGESFFEDKMANVLKELTEKGLMTESEGAKLVFFPQEEFPPLMIVKKDGATLYATRDLATDAFRRAHYGDDITIVNEVGAEQATYFRQLYRLEELAGWFKPGQRVHVKHGLYRFKDKKMSTRKGNVIWLEEVLDEAVQRVVSKDTSITSAEQAAIGLGALKWNDLKRSSHLDVVFDWDEILSLKGNSGPYVQYTAVRCQSVLAKAQLQGFVQKSSPKPFDTLLDLKAYLGQSLEKEEKEVLINLYTYFDTVQLAAREFAPHHLCTYLYELAQSYNIFYTQHTILGWKEGEAGSSLSPETLRLRIAITQAVAKVLSHGLGLLGIATVSRM